jgi:hypothetical protein
MTRLNGHPTLSPIYHHRRPKPFLEATNTSSSSILSAINPKSSIELSFIEVLITLSHATPPHQKFNKKATPHATTAAKMCRKATCPTCSAPPISPFLLADTNLSPGKSTWFGCGRHVPSVMDTIPSEDRCTCEPKVEKEGKEYPPMAESG